MTNIKKETKVKKETKIREIKIKETKIKKKTIIKTKTKNLEYDFFLNQKEDKNQEKDKN